MNRVVHFEINADNLERASKFYREAFGWEIKDMGPEMGNYQLVTTGKNKEGEKWPGIDGGIMPRMGKEATINTIDVVKIDEALQKIEQAGGKIVKPKQAIPGVGTFAYCHDTEGNTFGVIENEPESGEKPA